jgi:DNA helicase II / ATP-dependent DNA helicase PcrA
MKIIADFHIHSHFSLATSKLLIPEHLDYWARLKGITVIGTGDFTHPGWISELEEKLIPSEEGLFRLKDDLILKDRLLPRQSEQTVRFMLSAEVSSIYKKKGRVRKIHNLILAPDFKTVRAIQRRIQKIGGNITSDGRPILGLDARDLLELSLEASERIFFVPAHIWTPWFSVLGAKSGFDSIDECFEDLSEHIHAVETGLSSDPAMNWMCSFLDDYTLISNSDAHSPEKLGREANLLECELSYSDIVQTITKGSRNSFLGTIEFFPAEGKYHFDGHRNCGVCFDPVQTLENDFLCPKCGSEVTVGVMHRVADLADRKDISTVKDRPPFYSVIPLKEIIAEILGLRPAAKKVAAYYQRLTGALGPEFDILLNVSRKEFDRIDEGLLAEAVFRMRAGTVALAHGYDGQFGTVRTLVDNNNATQPAAQEKNPLLPFDLERFRRLNQALPIERTSRR